MGTRRLTRVGTHRVRAVTPAVGGFSRGDSATSALQVIGDVAGRGPVRAARIPSRDDPARVLVTGDSLAYWLGTQLRAAVGPLARTHVDSRDSTGLARPDVMDWPVHAARQMTTDRPEVVVEYARRVAEVAQVHTRGGALLYWVGMPIARDESTSRCFRAQTIAARSVALATAGMTWLDTWRPLAPGGRYSDEIAGVRVRGDDGIHLTEAGTRSVTQRVLDALAGDVRLRG